MLKIIFKFFITALGAFLVFDTIFALFIPKGSINFGIIMPIIIGTPLLVLGIFFDPIITYFNSCFFGKLLKFGMLFCYIAFFLLFTFTTALTISAGNKTPFKNADVLIVLGGGIHGESVTKLLANRLDVAVKYLNDNPNTKVIVTGGMGLGESVSEAFAMKKYLINKGISENIIFTEDKSESTYENFMFSKSIALSLTAGISKPKILFVTTAFHVFRAEKVAKAADMCVYGIGAKDIWYIALNNYFRECAAITQYFLTGKI